MRAGAPKNSVMLLVLANVIALAGVLVWDWGLQNLFVLYWAESAVIGIYHVIRIMLGFRVAGLLLAPFFVVHYGMFMMVHAIFIVAFFFDGGGMGGNTVNEVNQFLEQLTVVWPAIFALFVSHGYSFIFNGVYLGEYKEAVNQKTKEVFTDPYRRIMVMHFTIIFGGFLVLLLGSPTFAAALLIVLKTIVDARAHIKLHTKNFGSKDGSKEVLEKKKPQKGPQYVDYSRAQ